MKHKNFLSLVILGTFFMVSSLQATAAATIWTVSMLVSGNCSVMGAYAENGDPGCSSMDQTSCESYAACFWSPEYYAPVLTTTADTNKATYVPGEQITLNVTAHADFPGGRSFFNGFHADVRDYSLAASLLSQSVVVSRGSITGGSSVGAFSNNALMAPMLPGNYDIVITSCVDVPRIGTHCGDGRHSITVVGRTVNVSSNIAGASWTITGPATIPGSGVSASYPNEPTGGYTITWNAVAGYTTPATDAQTLTSGGAINFSGTYTAVAAPSSCVWEDMGTVNGFYEVQNNSREQDVCDTTKPIWFLSKTCPGGVVVGGDATGESPCYVSSTKFKGFSPTYESGMCMAKAYKPSCVAAPAPPAPTINVHF